MMNFALAHHVRWAPDADAGLDRDCQSVGRGLSLRPSFPTVKVVTDQGATHVAATDAIDDLLLEAKLSVPASRPGSVSRASLIDAARESACRVVDVTAPAGYGKSTFLTQWAQGDSRSVGWVSLDRFDDDPSILLRLLAAAFANISPGQADLVSDLGGRGFSPLARAAPRLAAVLRRSPVPFVLMLDDLHEVRSADCHDVLSVVISGVPDGSQLVAASRSEQPHAPRLRASGDVLELGAEDLALDASGAEEIFAQAAVELTPELAAAVTRRTEGWAVGLHLAAAIAHESNGEVLAVRGDDRYVADYLYNEVTSALPAGTQRFLRCTSVLEQLSAPLCDAVLEEPGSQQVLQQLEAASALLIPLDRRRQWYRFHPLFREFLASELLRVEPDAVEKLHLKAADWYEANGSTAHAIEHLLNTSARERCVQLVTALILPTYQSGQISTVLHWLDAVDDGDIARYPPLAVLAGWVMVFTGRTTEARRWAAVADDASFDLVPADGSASLHSARAMLRAALCASGPEAMIADATVALADEPSWSVWRDTALCVGAEALLLAGEPDQAAAMFRETSSVAAALSNTDSFVLSESELALLDMDGGRWAGAAAHLDRALAAVDEAQMEDYALSTLAFAAAGRHAVHRGDTEEARRQLTRAMRSRPTCTVALPWLAVRMRLQVAKVYEALGERRTVNHLLREIDDLLSEVPNLGLLNDEVRSFRRHLEPDAQGRHAGATPLSPAELRLLPYMQTHLTIREIGDRLFVSRNTVSSEIGSIYRKLGVSSRGAAVQRATAIGLLGG